MVRPSRSAFFSPPPELSLPGGVFLGVCFAGAPLGLLRREVQVSVKHMRQAARSIMNVEFARDNLTNAFECPQVGGEAVREGTLKEHPAKQCELRFRQQARWPIGFSDKAVVRVGRVAPTVYCLTTHAVKAGEFSGRLASLKTLHSTTASEFLLGSSALVVGYWRFHEATRRQAFEQRQSIL